MKFFRISKLICFVAGAGLILVFRDFSVSNLRWFIGGLMVLYGLLGILNIVFEKIRPIHNDHGFLFYCLEMLMGSTVLIFVTEFSTVCIMWAVWSVFRESVELREIVERKLHPALAVISGAESVAVIVLSIMLITEPGPHHAMIHVFLLCVELTLSSSIPIINHYLMKKRRENGDVSEKPDLPESSAPEAVVEEAAPSEEEIACKE